MFWNDLWIKISNFSLLNFLKAIVDFFCFLVLILSCGISTCGNAKTSTLFCTANPQDIVFCHFSTMLSHKHTCKTFEYLKNLRIASSLETFCFLKSYISFIFNELIEQFLSAESILVMSYYYNLHYAG